jgi:hypothetical protein
MVNDTLERISQLQQELKPLEDDVRNTNTLLKTKQQELVVRYPDNAREWTRNVIRNDVGGLFQDILNRHWDEKVEFIAAICQWYGEMAMSNMHLGSGRNNNMKICEPLRLAALDAGIIWDGKSVRLPKGWGEELVRPLLSRFGFVSLEEIVKENENWVDPENEILDGDYYHDHGHGHEEDDDEYGAGQDDDSYNNDQHNSERNTHRRRHHHRKQQQQHDQEHGNHSMEQQQQEENRGNHGFQFQSIFGKIMRSNFHKHAKELISQIDKIQSQSSDDENLPNAEEEEKEIEQPSGSIESDESNLSFDPMAIQMVRNTLSSRIGQVESGNELAKSAISMMTLLQDAVDSHDIESKIDLNLFNRT